MEKLKKKEFLLNLKKEIDEAKKITNPSKIRRFKNKAIMTSKMSIKLLRLIYPYILAAVISVGGTKLVSGGYPFVRDEQKKCLHKKTTISSIDGRVVEEQYGSFNGKNVAAVYFPWEYEQNEYRRIVEYYDISNKLAKEISSSSNSFDTYESICNMFGEAKSSVTQKSDALEIGEEEKNLYTEVVVYDIDKNSYLIELETKSNNKGSTIMNLLFLTFSELIAFSFASVRNYNKMDFIRAIKEIKEKYNLNKNEIERLNKILQIKIDNYNTLTRELKNGR